MAVSSAQLGLMICVVIIPFIVAVIVGFRLRNQQNAVFVQKDAEINKLTGLTKQQEQQLRVDANRLTQAERDQQNLKTQLDTTLRQVNDVNAQNTQLKGTISQKDQSIQQQTDKVTNLNNQLTSANAASANRMKEIGIYQSKCNYRIVQTQQPPFDQPVGSNDRLTMYRLIDKDYFLRSQNNKYSLYMWRDGMLRYQNQVGAMLWNSSYINDYYTSRATRMVFALTPYGPAVFDAKDQGSPNLWFWKLYPTVKFPTDAIMVLQNDGNMTILNPGGDVLWQTGTAGR